MEQLEQLRDFLLKKRPIPFFEEFSDYTRTLRPGDRFIFGILGIIIAITSIISIYALEQSLLVVEPVQGGSLTEGDVGSARFVNPLLAISNTDQDLTALTYAGLMGLGPNGTLVPVLAQSYIVSPDGLTYQFTLRANAKFSDGTPVTAQDVVFTVQKAQDVALKSPQYQNWQGVTATAVDSRTVQFTLSAPYAPFLENTTLGILPEHIWENVTDDEFPFSDYEIKPVGAGPFVMSDLERDSSGNITGYDLSANPNYVLGRPYLDSMHFVFYTDANSLQTALNGGQVESGYGVTGPNVLTAPYARVFAVFFNPNQGDFFTKTPPRQALSVAIDRRTIVQNVFGGKATAINGPVPSDSGVPSLPIPTNNIASATAILRADGWKLSTSTNQWTKSGETLSVTIKTANVPELQAMAQIIQTDWKQLGVQTTIDYYQPGDLTQNVIQPRNFEALLFGMVVGRGDDLYDFWDSASAAAPGLNITSYKNPQVDKLLQDIRTNTSIAARASDLAQVNQLISSDYPAAFIESPDFVYVVPKDLRGVILPQITSPADRFANVQDWYRRTESVWPFLSKAQR